MSIYSFFLEPFLVESLFSFLKNILISMYLTVSCCVLPRDAINFFVRHPFEELLDILTLAEIANFSFD